MLIGRTKLEKMRIAVLAADGFEEIELTEPKKTLEKRGASVEVVSLRSGSVQGMNRLKPGNKFDVDHTIAKTRAGDFDGLLLPGGAIGPDALRQSEEVLGLVREFETSGKPMAVIGHGVWVLASAGLVDGRKLTSSPTIRDDVRNAGGFWMDQAVVHDHNWVTGRSRDDLGAFVKATVKLFVRHAEAAAKEQKRGTGRGRKLAVGAIAVGAIGYAINRRRK